MLKARYMKKTNAQRGLSLIEILIGVFIGLIGMLAMFSVFALVEKNRRSATTGSDAQSAAAVSLFKLEREVAQAGYGFGGANLFFNCDVAIYRSGRTPNTFTTKLAPVVITDGGAGPDIVQVWYGNSSITTNSQSYSVGAATTKTPDYGVAGFAVNDVVLATPSAGCISLALIQVSAKVGNSFDHTTGPFNKATPLTTATSGFLNNLGPAPIINTWQVGTISNAQGLVVQDFLNVGTGGTMAGENVVDLQARYLVDVNTASGVAPDIREITDPDTDPDTVGLPDRWARIVAVRVAVLVRSDNWEKDPVTSFNALNPLSPKWAGGTVPFAAPALADGSDPTHYRYRVYESVMPLRNVVWGQDA